MVDETRVRAADIMQTDVVKLHCNAPIDDAVETFEEYSISGAPVVDDAENIVGVLSASDIVRTDHVHHEAIETGSYYRADPLEEDDDSVSFGREDYDPEILDRKTVADWMTPKVISVPPDASLAEVCGAMAREGIHRVFVVDDGRLAGVISSLDVVKYLAGPRST